MNTLKVTLAAGILGEDLELSSSVIFMIGLSAPANAYTWKKNHFIRVCVTSVIKCVIKSVPVSSLVLQVIYYSCLSIINCSAVIKPVPVKNSYTSHTFSSKSPED